MSTPPRRRRRTVLLFGKTGDGKSTLANMLTNGATDGDFASGDSLSSLTKKTNFRISTCTNWTVIDTVGLFATDTPEHDLQRTLELRNYLAENHPSIEAFCYVKKASKFTRADEQCWRAFHQALFAHNGEHPHYHDNVLLVFTSCKRKECLDENLSSIREMMAPPVVPSFKFRDEIAVPIVEDIDNGRFRYRSIGVDFPPHDEDPVVESKLEKSRSESLRNLKLAIDEVELPLPLCKLPAVEPVIGSRIPWIGKTVQYCWDMRNSSRISELCPWRGTDSVHKGMAYMHRDPKPYTPNWIPLWKNLEYGIRGKVVCPSCGALVFVVGELHLLKQLEGLIY